MYDIFNMLFRKNLNKRVQLHFPHFTWRMYSLLLRSSGPTQMSTRMPLLMILRILAMTTSRLGGSTHSVSFMVTGHPPRLTVHHTRYITVDSATAASQNDACSCQCKGGDIMILLQNWASGTRFRISELCWSKDVYCDPSPSKVKSIRKC